MNKKDQRQTYRVLIEANKLLMPGNDGVKRYLINLLEALKTAPAEIDIDLYVQGVAPFPLNDPDQKLEEKIAAIQVHPPSEVRLLQIKERIRRLLPESLYEWLSSIYALLPLRYFARRLGQFLTRRDVKQQRENFGKYDLIHIPLPQNIHYLSSLKARFLVTIHDLSHQDFPHFHTKDNISRTTAGMDWLAESQADVLAVSEATKKDVLETYPLAAQRVHRVYGSYDEAHFYPRSDQDQLKKVLDKYGLPHCAYFLTLSTLEPRKNLPNMLKAFSAFATEQEEEVALFVCGKNGWKTEQLRKAKINSPRQIHFPGFIAEEDLPVLYSHALALCYVSFYEGFGLPPLEAMACGTTVIYGYNSVMPEVIGAAGLSAEPNDMDAIKTQMQRLFSNAELRTSLEAQAIKRATFFSRKKMATEVLNVYRCLFS